MNEIKSLYIIVEGQTDARILHTLLNCTRYKKVYHIPAGGFANLSSMATTIRLMQAPKEAANKIVVAFDADSEKKDVINDRYPRRYRRLLLFPLPSKPPLHTMRSL